MCKTAKFIVLENFLLYGIHSEINIHKSTLGHVRTAKQPAMHNNDLCKYTEQY